MMYQLKIQSEAINSEIKILQRAQRKLKAMKARKESHQIYTFTDNSYKFTGRNSESVFLQGKNEDGYATWGNKRLLELQYIRKDASRLARLIHLARMFLRGTPYRRAEWTNNPGNELTLHDVNVIGGFVAQYAEYSKMGDNNPRPGTWRSEQQLISAFEVWIKEVTDKLYQKEVEKAK